MASFGRYLAQERELRALSRDDVARQTRLSLASIAALEEDRYEALPGEAFVLGYVRSYAGCIGLAPDEAVLRYQEYRQETTEPAEAPKPRRRVLLPAGLAAAVLLASVAAAWWHWGR